MSVQAEFKLLAPGLVHVHIHGGQKMFESIGVNRINDTSGEKDLHFLTACGATYDLHVVGGNAPYTAASRISSRSAFGAILEENLAKIFTKSAPLVAAYING
ncbi:hypothetical protein H0H87_009700, partial [Tephrocybe sp. NHM501043]